MKTKFAAGVAFQIADNLCFLLNPHCLKIAIAGSLRRQKSQVGDIEIVFIPKMRSVKIDLFYVAEVPSPDDLFKLWLDSGVIAKRKNKLGHESWGPKNKLAVHVGSGIPVDFFTATEENWFNYLVCRTGSAENNIEIAKAAQAKGWMWQPYGKGFIDKSGEWHQPKSEEEVFTLVGLPYLAPKDR